MGWRRWPGFADYKLDGYEVMGFGAAIRLMKGGERVSREGWNDKVWVALQLPDEHSKMGAPYFYISTVSGKLVPWLPNQADLLADDWKVL